MKNAGSSDLLIADFGIRQLHARYIDATWRQDRALFRDCFMPDAEWQIAGMHLQGREEIAAAFGKLTDGSRRVLMTLSLLIREVKNDEASADLRVTESIKRADGGGVRTLGEYRDHYRYDGTQWRFQSRRWRRDYVGPMDLSGPLEEN